MAKNPAIQEILSSEKTAENIGNICEKYGVFKEEQIENIAYQIGLVLLGKLPPEKLAQIFERKAQLSPGTSKKISFEVNQTILSQVKDELTKLYKKETPFNEVEEKPKKSPRKDRYREIIE